MGGQIALGLVVLVIYARTFRQYRARNVQNALVSGLGATMYTLCLWVPAKLQESGALTSKIFRAGVAAHPTASEIDALSWKWALELSIILFAELLVVYAYSHHRPKPEKRPREQWLRISICLILVGLVATIVFPAELESRAAEGQGIFVLLRTSLVCGLAILAFFNCFSRKSMWLLLIGGTAFLVLENVRSPLFVILIAYAAGLIVRGVIYNRKAVVSIAVAVVVAIGFSSFMSEMRANITRNEGLSTSDIVSEMSEAPLVAAYKSGVDTLDGYRFSALVADVEPARPYDLLSPITTFIPRAVWEDKPPSISVELSSKYLGYKASGQFLSMIGFLTLATGGYGSALLLFAVFFLVASALVQVFQRRFALTIVLVVIFRILLGGSAFDIYYGLVLTVIVGTGVLGYDLWRFLNRSPQSEDSVRRSYSLR
ncbi:hypothetical protein SAMN04490240_1407 [Rhodococcus pyridinivorans]|uniref:hypothetical protein n=1 Tax=Rhodococcus pyridinivorans TaxID=103816 RepID=UPI000897DCB3|nr:hypothetical protein [Rhodococcus pyridinivorans]QXF82808.1 hypothetical protein HBA53_18745 [Rhodococcus pyridinivorans]SEC26936.1 hypothetical protein SAMN04490240_1407 [Rhodococcus pyridinivorans]